MGSGGGSVSCTAASLAAAAAATVSVTATVAPTQQASITNTATISSATPDPSAGNNSDAATTQITTQADVGVTLTGPSTAVAGTTVTLQLVAVNNGPSMARNVVVTGHVPPGLVPVLGSSGGACTYTAGTGTVTCQFGDLPAGASTPPIPLQALVDPSQPPGTINATATIGSDTPDTVPANNSSTWPITVTAQAGLSISKTMAPTPAVAGAPATYTLTVSNAGPSDAQAVQVVDDLVPGLTILSANPTLGSCTVTGQHVACSAATVQAHSSMTVTVATVVSPSATGSLANTATVSSTTPDPTPGDNSATITTPVIQTAHLTLSKTASPNPIVAGAAVTYTLTMVNNGPSDAADVVLTDPLPAGFAVLPGGITSTGDRCPEQTNAATVTCSFGTVEAGGVRTVQITASTPATLAPGAALMNTATVASSTDDSDPSGRTASTTTPVVTSADLSISKSPVTDPIEAGALQTYVLQITNNGPSVSRGVVVTDPLPSGVTFQSVVPSSGCTVTAGTLSCALGDLGRSETANLQVTVKLDPSIGGTRLTNTASVASSPTAGAATGDPTSSNNSSTVSQLVATRSDLSLTKAITSGPIVAGSTLSYQLVATNNGPSDTTNMMLTDPVPTGTTLVTANASDGGTCQLADPLVCTWPSVVAGANRTITLSVTVPPTAAVGSTITNTAAVTSANVNTTPETSTATAGGPVTASADLSVVKTLLSGTPVAGGSATWQLVVSNAGPSQAANVVLDDTAPTGVTFTSTTPSTACAIAAGAVHCGFGALSGGATVTATVTGSLAADYTGATVTNSATVNSDTADPDSSNNTSTNTSDATESADLSLTKVATSSPFVAGTRASWTITVNNAGPSVAANAVVTDVLPAGITGATATVAGGTACTTAPGTGVNAGSTVVTCPVGPVSTTTPAHITVTGTLAASAITPTISNTASVAASTPDPNTADNTVTSTTPVTASADLSLAKTGPADLHAGQQINWRLDVSNTGPSDAQGATVTDTLPAGIAGASGTGPGGACSLDNSVMTCALGAVAAGSTATVTVTATVGTDISDTLHNSATVTSSTTDPNIANNTASSDTVVTRSADVSVTKTSNATAAVPGDSIGWTIAATNAGPSTATEVLITDALPAGVTAITATVGPSHTPCEVIAQDVSCPIGDMAPGGAVNVAVTGTLASSYDSATLDNTATITSPDDDDTPAENSSTSSTPVTPSADVAVGKALISGPPVAGAAGTYQVTVTNAGPSDATNVAVTDQLPTEFRGSTAVLGGVAGDCTIAGAVISCTIPDLPLGTTPVVTINGTFDQTLGDTVTNTARVTSDTDDPAPSNNTSTATGSLGESADLQVSKTGPATVTAGGLISWQIQVHNAGPSIARDVTVSDTPPAAVGGVTASVSGAATCSPASCAVGAIAVDATVTVTVTGTVAASFTGTSVTNTVLATGSSPDPNGGNNQASARPRSPRPRT